MSIDALHDKIRKLKNPSMVDFGIEEGALPPHLIQEEGGYLPGYIRFCRELMTALRGTVPAVRFSFSTFALMDGLSELRSLLSQAKELGYYVLLDAPEILSPWGADRIAGRIFGGEDYPCDALLITPWIGADGVRPFVGYCKDEQKDLFVVLRSPNKSAPDIQDLLTGNRLVHGAAGDIVSRFGDGIVTKCGYSRIGAAVSAGALTSLQNLRNSYKRMFLLVDGLDYPSGKYTNCAYAFDRFGYGAVVCAGPSVTAAWKEGESDGRDYTQLALEAAQRMKKNLLRYVTIL